MALVVRYTVIGLLAWTIHTTLAVLLGASKGDLDKALNEYDITHPVVVSMGGCFITNDLKNAEAHTHRHYLKRRKRSLEDIDTVEVDMNERKFIRMNNTIDVRNDMYYDKDNGTLLNIPRTTRSHSHARLNWTSISPRVQRRYLNFNISAFGSSFQLRVKQKYKLIAPGAKSVSFTPDGERIEKDLNPGCFFSGKIPHHPRSKVAISNCKGLTGLIQTDVDEFFLEPLENQFDGNMPQKHVIYRRSALTKSDNVGKSTDFHRKRRATRLSASGPLTSVADPVTIPLADRGSQAWLGSKGKQKRHAKRNDYNMEVLLAADSEVVRFHGRDHVENYLLTLINIVDEIYHDTSLGEHINIVLSRIYLLDEQKSSALILENSPSASLKNVCKWAQRLHQTDPGPYGRRPDHTIFLTRRRFGPAGYAHVSGMCRALRSCSLNLEDGFSSSFVVAHETGHVLGMEHDGEGNRCEDETSMGSIMAPLVQAAFHRFHWSRCSQQELKTHLGRYSCLLDDPHAQDRGPSPIYPGVQYSLDDQCRFDFGQSYRRCTAFYNMNVCASLWCSPLESPQLCKSKRGPPLDGTDCGENMWCFKGHCVWRDLQQRSVDGNWGTWTAFTKCSRTCGTGVMYRSRMCDSPAPSRGGRNCNGKTVSYSLCNKQACVGGRDYRAEQCMTRNNVVEYKNQRHKWLPYEPFQATLKCELFCKSEKTNDVVTMGDIVVDGTPCSYEDPHGICIQGECVEVGCDGLIGSNNREDDCGVCEGDGRQCRSTNGRLNKRIKRRTNSYIKLFRIPDEARHIRIQEVAVASNSNLLALKSPTTKPRYFLNAKKKHIQESETPLKLINGGTMWHYESRNGVETITARGPTSSDIIVMILVVQRNVKMSVRYSYILHRNRVAKSRDQYRYEIKRWNPCSATCGFGHEKAKYRCRSVKGRKWTSKRRCRGKPPATNRRLCRVECRLPPRWVPGDWTSCSKTCGSGGMQERNATCQGISSLGRMEVLEASVCSEEERPAVRQPCRPNHTHCPSKWQTGSWSLCSKTCGEGIQRRQVTCVAHGRNNSSKEGVCKDDKPAATKPCEVASCGSNVCENDQSRFCRVEAMARYCNISRYRMLCCVSCRNFRLSNTNNEATTDLKALDEEHDGVLGRKNFTRASSTTSVFAKHGSIENAMEASMKSSIDGGNFFSHEPSSPIDASVVSANNRSSNIFAGSATESLEENIIGIVVEERKNDRYHGNTIRNELLDGEDDLHGFILPNNRSHLQRSADSSLTRRRRSVANLQQILKRLPDCPANGCDVGVRHAAYGCWNASSHARVSLSKCFEMRGGKTLCAVPCYSKSKSAVAVYDDTISLRPSLECREIKEGCPGPRTNPRKCRGIAFRKDSADIDKHKAAEAKSNQEKLVRSLEANISRHRSGTKGGG